MGEQHQVSGRDPVGDLLAPDLALFLVREQDHHQVAAAGGFGGQAYIDTMEPKIAEVRAMIDKRRYRVSFPIEVRAAAADDLMLSTAAGRESGYIAVHRYAKDDPADSAAYFADVEAIMTAHAGRPHWGKMHTRDADYLRTVYPRFDEFVAVRDRFDPDRVFTNDYLDRVLGA